MESSRTAACEYLHAITDIFSPPELRKDIVPVQIPVFAAISVASQ